MRTAKFAFVAALCVLLGGAIDLTGPIGGGGPGFGITDLVGSASGSPTYYVNAGTGSDSNAGTQASPWQTLHKVNNSVFSIIGTTINLEGSFSGGDNGLIITTTVAPIGGLIIQSYGAGATISSGNSTACLTATNVPDVTISNIICTGGGNTSNTTAGISIVNSQAGNTKLAGPSISGVTVSGYGLSGINIEGTNGNSGFAGTTLTNNTIHDTTGNSTGFASCIFVWSSTGDATSHSGGTISGNTGYNCTGTSGQPSGNGILVEEANHFLVKLNVAHDFGANGTNPVGIWTNNADSITITFNEAYNGKTASADGDGFGLDVGTTNSVLSYNWSHDNVGYGAYIYTKSSTCCTQGWGNNVVSFNILQNNATAEFVMAGLHDATGPLYFFNNTLYCARSGGLCVDKTSSSALTATLANNIFYGVGAANIVTAATPSNVNFYTNDYIASTGNPAFSWNGTGYASVALWQAGTSQDATALTSNPKLYVPGGGFINAGYAPTKLYAYNLQSGSPMIGAGINVQTQFGVNPGTQDYFGATISAASLPVGAAAGDFAIFTASCAQATTGLALTTGFTKLDNVNYNSWVCGSQSDGDLAQMDGAWLTAAPNHAAMLLDWSGNGHNLTEHGTVTFTARTGIASDGTTGYEDTGWNVNNGPNYTLTSVTLAGYDETTTGAFASFQTMIGVSNTAGTTEAQIAPRANANPGVFCDANDETGTGPNTSASGFSLCQRTIAGNDSYYKNNTRLTSNARATVALPNANMFLLAQSNGGGSGVTSNFLTDTVGMAFAGGGGISPLNTSLRANSFMQAYGINVY